MFSKNILLNNLNLWRDNMSEFTEEEMDYLYLLVEEDIYESNASRTAIEGH
jgi:hypothetical protein